MHTTYIALGTHTPMLALPSLSRIALDCARLAAQMSDVPPIVYADDDDADIVLLSCLDVLIEGELDDCEPVPLVSAEDEDDIVLPADLPAEPLSLEGGAR